MAEASPRRDLYGRSESEAPPAPPRAPSAKLTSAAKYSTAPGVPVLRSAVASYADAMFNPKASRFDTLKLTLAVEDLSGAPQLVNTRSAAAGVTGWPGPAKHRFRESRPWWWTRCVAPAGSR